jgi:hypothetical protein
MHYGAIITDDRRVFHLKVRGCAKLMIHLGRAIDNPAARLDVRE